MTFANKPTSTLVIFFLLFLNSCIEPFSPPPIDGEKVIVIEGSLDISEQSASVLLSYSRDLTSIDNQEFITGADLSIEGEDGISIPLADIDSGKYYAENLEVNFNNNYRLVINIKGETYISDFAKAKPTPEIDSVFWRKENNGIGIYVNTHDPSNQSIFYKWNYEETWHYRASFYSQFDFDYDTKEVLFRFEDIYNCWKYTYPKNILVASTESFSEDRINEQPIIFIPYLSQKLKVKYSVLVKQQTIDKQAYEYWNNVRGNTESLGTLFDPIPFDFKGNIRSETSPQETVLGYFTVGATKSQRIFIDYYDVRDDIIFSYGNCRYDTLLLADLSSLYQTENLISEIPSEFGPGIIGYTKTSNSCSDCTLTGTNIKPIFWE